MFPLQLRLAFFRRHHHHHRWIGRRLLCVSPVVNPTAPTTIPFSHEFVPKVRVYPHVEPHENQEARKQRHKANPLSKMSVREAVAYAKEHAPGYYDETFQLSFSVQLDIRHANQMIRSSAILPNGTGKNLKVAVFAEGEMADEAREAGADFVGGTDLAEYLLENKRAADRVLATPEAMRHISGIAKKLGSRGMMPNPKQGTIVRDDMKQAVFDAKYRMVTYRTRRNAMLNTIVGKISFPDELIVENIVAVVDKIVTERPPAAKAGKSKYVRAAYLKTTQGRVISLRLGQPPFISPKKLVRGYGELPPRLLERLKAQESKELEEKIKEEEGTDDDSTVEYFGS